MSRNVTAQSVTDGPGTQAKLADTPECSTMHQAMKAKWDLSKCPHCEADLSTMQMRLETYV